MSDKKLNNLAQAITTLDNPKDVQNFLYDLCTPQELSAMAERWEIAQLLNAKELSYRAIAEKTGASTATITRVGRFLNQERHHGYKIAISRL